MKINSRHREITLNLMYCVGEATDILKYKEEIKIMLKI